MVQYPLWVQRRTVCGVKAHVCFGPEADVSSFRKSPSTVATAFAGHQCKYYSNVILMNASEQLRSRLLHSVR